MLRPHNSLLAALAFTSLSFGAWAAQPVTTINSPLAKNASSEESFVVAPDAPIQVEATPKPDVNSVGTLKGAQGLGDALWSGMAASTLIEQIRHLPDTIPSPAMRALVSKALQTQASVPESKTGPGVLLAERVVRLITIGDTVAGITLLKMVPASMLSPEVSQLINQALWLDGNTDQACTDLDQYAGDSGIAYWKQMRVICQLIRGKTDEAALGQEVLREQNKMPKGFIADVYKRLTNPKSPIIWPKSYTLQEASLLPLVGVPDSAWKSVFDALPLGVMKHLAGVRKFVLPVAARIQLAEKQVALGLSKPEDVLAVYRSVSIAQTAEKGNTPISRAAVIQKIDAATDAKEKVHYITTLIAAFDSADLKPVAKRILPILTGDLDPQSLDEVTRKKISAPLFEAWVMAEKFNTAAAWDNSPAAQNLIAFAQAKEVTVGYGTPACASRMMTLAAALDEAVDASTGIYDRKPMNADAPSAKLMQQLRASASKDRKGEVILLSAIALSSSPLAKTSDLILADVLGALKQAGFANEARAIALEDILACP
jgi:hypothetical protein